MAEAKKSPSVGALARGFSELPGWRQTALVVGIALSIALVVGLALWSQQPTYRKLFGNLADNDAGMVIAALEQAQVPFKVDEVSGSIMVPADRVHQVRMSLAAQGLPKGAGSGFEELTKDQGFGTSQFMQQAQYQHAVELELSSTIESMDSVQKARVHLAVPKRSVFLRDRQQPTASVMVSLFPGRTLEKGQVSAIVHLVASSVPGLQPKEVKVVDHEGRLLTMEESSSEMEMSAKQYEYTRKVEQDYTKRIEHILSPIVGPMGVRAQVSADIDFSVTERTQERFNPDLSAVRSEQIVEDETRGEPGTSGVPGALSNQPPGGGVAPEVAGGGIGEDGQATKLNSSKRVTRNYEVDRTVSHTKLSTGNVRRLSVAVVVNHRKVTDAEGKATTEPLTEQEMAKINTLVQEAVGYTAQRGDTINVINAPFMEMAEVEAAPEVPLWKEPWFWELSKQILGGLAVLFVIFGVLRPILSGLAQRGETANALMATEGGGGMMGQEMEEERVSLTAERMPQLEAPSESQAQMDAIKGLVAQDPKIVAQTLKSWLAVD